MKPKLMTSSSVSPGTLIRLQEIYKKMAKEKHLEDIAIVTQHVVERKKV